MTVTVKTFGTHDLPSNSEIELLERPNDTQ